MIFTTSHRLDCFFQHFQYYIQVLSRRMTNLLQQFKQALQWTLHAKPQRKRTTQEYLEQRSEKNVDSRFVYSWRKLEAAA